MVEIGCIFTIKIHAWSTPFGVSSCPLFKLPLYRKNALCKVCLYSLEKNHIFSINLLWRVGVPFIWKNEISLFKDIYAPRLTEISQWFWKRKFLVEWQCVVIYLFLRWSDTWPFILIIPLPIGYAFILSYKYMYIKLYIDMINGIFL